MSELKKDLLTLSVKETSRFWAKVNRDSDCWLWTASKMFGGYGGLKVAGNMRQAHRLSWMIHNGAIPDGLHVLHKCDVPACVNPDHLFLGTHQDNMRDKARKGRCNPVVGANHHSKVRPGIMARGLRNGSHTRPERRATGLRNGKHTKPERTPRGELSGTAKLTNEEITSIRLSPLTGVALSIKHNVTPSLISRIRLRKAWKHIP